MDCMAAHGNLEIYNYVGERYHSIAEEEFRPRPLLTGDDLIAAGYSPTQFKEMLQAAEDAQLEGAIATPRRSPPTHPRSIPNPQLRAES